jgi:hypothetical protein
VVGVVVERGADDPHPLEAATRTARTTGVRICMIDVRRGAPIHAAK